MLVKLQRLLEKSLAIREGEWQRVLLMQLAIFLLITTLLIVKPVVNGLFLAELGVKSLPIAFLMVAAMAGFISWVYNRLLQRVFLNQILFGTLFSSAIFFVVFGFLLRFNLAGGWVLYPFYVGVALFGVLSASQFWILANMVFNAREAKRLFGLIGSGAIAGGIFGGYLTSLLAEPLGSENMLFVAAFLLLLCLPIIRFIWKKKVLATQSLYQRRKKVVTTDHPLALIRRSPHLTYLAGIIGLSVVVAKLVDYQFSAVAADKIPDPDELTAFFGFWFSTFNLLSLLIQLLLTRRFIGYFGVGSSLLPLPFGILVGAFCLFWAPELWAAVLIKLSDGSLKQSINKAAVELLALHIPTEIKNQTKTFIDVVIDSVATGVSGVLLIVLVSGLDLSVRAISVLILLCILIWLYLVRKVGRSYLDTLRQGMQRFSDKNQEDPISLPHESVISDLQLILEGGAENQILYVLRKLRQQPDERLAEPLVSLLEHPSAKVIEETIRVLYFLKSVDVSANVRLLTKHTNQALQVAAFDYLLARSPEEGILLLEESLQAAEPSLRAAALISLAAESRDNSDLKEAFQLVDHWTAQHEYYLSIKDTDEGKCLQMGLLQAAGLAKIPQFFPWIEEALTHPDTDIVKQALEAGSATLHPYFIPLLIKSLESPALQTTATEGLVNYGTEIISYLAQFAAQPAVDPKLVAAFPKVIAHFKREESTALLIEWVGHEDAQVRLAALEALNQLKLRYAYLDFKHKKIWKQLLQEVNLYQDLLIILYVQRQTTSPEDAGNQRLVQAQQRLEQLLEQRLSENLERVFRLLGLRYPPDDMLAIYHSLQSESPDQRESALDFLDNLLEAGLKKVVLPLVETNLLSSITDTAIRGLDRPIPDAKESYDLILQLPDEELHQAVLEVLKLLPNE